MLKKMISLLLATTFSTTILTTGFTILSHKNDILAVENYDNESDYRYFYQQLTPESKVFYDAIYQMYSQGILKTGTESLDMVAEGYISKSDAEDYALSGGNILAEFGTARDAFYMDYTDVFYVDFSSLSVRVTSGNDGYHIYLGSGRRDNYYADGFTCVDDVDKALAEYNNAVNLIASAANDISVEEDKELTAEKIKYVHNYIINHTSYRLEDVCKPENVDFIRTSFGSVVKGEAACEGYSRAFKSVLDRLNIPCVLVSGIYRHTADSAELHMWTDVQLDDGVWYGVDTTMDDPKTNNVSDSGVDGYECDELLLVGDSEISKHHVASNILSEANFEFEYPVLQYDNFGECTVRMENGLDVTYDPDGIFEGEKTGIYTVSYEGMGYAKSAEQGKYIVCNMTNYYNNSDEWDNTGWIYITPEYYPAITDTDTEIKLPLPQIQYIQFGVTDIAPGVVDYNGYEIPDSFYHGDPDLLLASSETYYNPSGNYIAPPCVISSSPTIGRSVNLGEKYHVTITYSDVLIPVEGEEQYISFTTDKGNSSIENSVLENFEWDGESTVSFDFTSSPMWADDYTKYTFYFNGVVGKRSNKAPYEYTFTARHLASTCCYRSQGYYWNLFAQPALMENNDISINDWMTSDGEPVSEKISDRMVLIATSPSHQQTDQMNEMISETSDDKILASQTFNIDITICNKSFISTGDGVRLSLGFPEGYGPDDEGVTFKVYHFMRDKTGSLTGIEEIPCTITKYGLVVLCKSFSPYAIVAVEDNGINTLTEKSLIISSTKGGTITGASGIEYLSEGESLTFKITADDENVIDSISINSKKFSINPGEKTAEITIAYEDIMENSSIIDIKFVAESVITREVENGETAIQIDSEEEQNNNSSMVEYTLGDVDGNNEIDSNDATLVLNEYSLIITNKNGTLTAEQNKAADIDRDGKVDSIDATIILSYYSYTLTGKNISLEEYLENN